MINQFLPLYKEVKEIQDNPYIFSKHLSEIERDDERRSREQEIRLRLPFEWEVLKEERLTHFQHDQSLQKIFRGNFQEYFKACDDPDYMWDKLIERSNEIWEEVSGEKDQKDAPQVSFGEFAEEVEFENFEEKLTEDRLWLETDSWVESVGEWARNLYFARKIKDRDLFRVYVNVSAVSAKITFAVSTLLYEEEFIEQDLEMQRIERELSIDNLKLAAIYLTRSLESLRNLLEKNIGREDEIIEFIKGGEDLALLIEERIKENEVKNN